MPRIMYAILILLVALAMPAQAAQPGPAFDFTAETFLQRFNRAGQGHNLPWLKIKERMSLANSAGASIQCVADDDMAALLRTDGSRRLTEVTLIQRAPAGNPTRVILGMASLMDAVSPGLEAKGRGSILKGLGLLNGGDLPKSSSYEFRGVKYSWAANGTIGLWLSASPAK